MANLFATNLRLVGLKQESVAGVAETLANTDYDIKFIEGDLSSLEVTFADDSRYMNGTLTRDLSTAGIVRGGMSLKANVKMAEWIAEGTSSSISYTDKFPIRKALAMAGLKVVNHKPTGLASTERGYYEIYSTNQSLCQTVTGELLDVQSCSQGGQKGIAYKLKGMTSALTITADEAGSPFSWNFETQAAVDSVTEKTVVPQFDESKANSTRNIPFINTDIKITPVDTDGSDNGSTPITFCVSTFSLDFQNTISELICADDEFGLKQTIVTDRDPQLTIGVALKALSEFDYWGALNSEQVYKIEVVTYEETAKTLPMFKIEISRGQMITANNTDDNGFRRLENTFRALTNIQGTKEKDVVVKVYGVTVDQTT